jgi:hypothetical protein
MLARKPRRTAKSFIVLTLVIYPRSLEIASAENPPATESGIGYA